MKLDIRLLLEILAQPSAPFREALVARLLESYLDEQGVRHFRDPIGNIVVGVGSKAEYLKLVRTSAREPVRVFIAHMDHPGFHGVRWRNPRALEVKWFGGSPRRHLNGAKVWLATDEGSVADGVFSEAKLLKSGAAIQSGVVKLARPMSREASALFGGFAFRAPVWESKRLLYAKAADDLVGVSVITGLAAQLARSRAERKLPFLGILTRAEEVGFIGAIGHFELGWLRTNRRPILAVSLETSRALPGAEIGKGPVVRLGDRATTFHSGSLSIFSALARKVLPDRHQRRIMDGGTCEGTAATVYGFPTVAISIPLGNYHNQSFEGGPDSRGPLGPAPEFVHLDDIQGMVTLVRALMEPGQPWGEPWAERRKQFRKSWRASAALLKRGRPT